MILASLIPVAIAAVRAVEGAFGKGKGAAKASTARNMLNSALGGLVGAGEIAGSDAMSVDLAAMIEMAVQVLKERGDLGGVKSPASPDLSKVGVIATGGGGPSRSNSPGDNPPMQMSMPAGAVLTIQF